jgi:thioredoxin-dependent peroxiredoxin
MERTGVVTFKGNPVTLVGPELKVGDPAPDFVATNSTLADFKLSDLKGEVVIISAVPSIDTGVCELQTKRFNAEAANLNAKVVTISLDLPFAQKRFCGANDVTTNVLVSDYKYRSFQHAYGILMKELGLLSRSVFVIDKEGTLVYQQIVGEGVEQPNYDAAVAAAKAAGA